MKFSFFIYGHENILSTHKNTLEFTKDKEVSLKGDCIVGVNSDFDYKKLIEFVKTKKNDDVKLTLFNDTKKLDKVEFILNRNFKDKEEIVIRKTDFLSDRTLGINADKSSKQLSRELITLLKEPKTKIKVVFE